MQATTHQPTPPAMDIAEAPVAVAEVEAGVGAEVMGMAMEARRKLTAPRMGTPCLCLPAASLADSWWADRWQMVAAAVSATYHRCR